MTPAPHRPADHPGRFGLLLGLLVVTYVLSAFTSGRWVATLQVALFAATALLAVRSSAIPRRTARLAGLSVLVGTVVAFGLSFGDQVERGLTSTWTGLILLLAVIVIVYRVLSFGTVTIQSIFGAVSAYLILGLMFAAFYAAIDHLGGGHFFADGQPADTRTYQYFSFATLTTVGYGDFTAAGNGGRAIAVLEALTGQIFLATLVARLVAAFRGRADRPEHVDRGDSAS
jgi:hypothetical protein